MANGDEEAFSGNSEAGVSPQVDDRTEDEIEGVLPFQYSITSYGADYPVDSLVKRLRSDAIYVPEFQRGFVWTLSQCSRFIESLLLGLPVPGIFLAKDDDSQRLLVIDGQQRLLTLRYFYDGLFADSGREFVLRGVLPQYAGLTYRTLSEADRLRMDDSIIHATIVQQDHPSEDRSSIVHIFERLNTGGTPLSAQEIRACIFQGPFNDLLHELNTTPEWREIFGRVNSRMKDQELILRFLALERHPDTYAQPMKAFLNSFMGRHRHIEKERADELGRLFQDAVRLVHSCLGARAFKPERALNAAVFDAMMVGIAKRLRAGRPLEDGCDQLAEKYERLLTDPEFVAATRASTSSTENVHSRINMAIRTFAELR